MTTEPVEQQLPGAASSQTENLLDNLGSLSDNEFFQRLSTLRTEHKRTLIHYEQLYHEKLMAETGGDIGMIFGQPLFSNTGKQCEDVSDKPNGTNSLCVTGVSLTARPSSPASKSTSPPKTLTSPAEKPTSSPESSTSPPKELTSALREGAFTSSLDELFRAPTTETHGRDYHLSLQQPVNATGGDTFNQNLEIVRRSAVKPPRSSCPVHKCRDAWAEDDTIVGKTRDDSSGDEADYANYDETRYQRTKDAALDRIESMWDDFRLSDYKEEKTSTKRRNSTDWRHRITMPEPFRMTLREESKPKHKSRTLSEYEHVQAMKEIEERFECEKKFRATPVPAHVYMPLYEEIMEKAETRRRTNVQIGKEVLKSQDKPFQFNERQKKIPDHGRRHSAPVVKHTKQFKAKPIPKSVREDVSERILEEEEYRKIRIRMRSKELLRSASLPPRMASREQYTVGKLKEKLKEGKERSQKSSTRKFQPRIKKKLPDFDTIHRKQQKEAANRYKNLEPKIATVCEPFNLRSSVRPSSIDKIMEDIEKDEQEMKENRWPYKNPRTKPKLGEVRRSYDALPTHSTNASDLRSSKYYEELRRKTAKELQDEKNRQRQAEMARQRKRQIAEKARANDRSQSLKTTNAERLRSFREEQRIRLKEYEKELADMDVRVNQQPFLFERQSQLNARKRAEKRFEDALREAGVDEQSLSSLTRQQRGPRAPDEVANLTDDDADDIPTRDVELDATYDATARNDDNDKEEEYHYSHSFVDEDVDDDEGTRRDSLVEELAA